MKPFWIPSFYLVVVLALGFSEPTQGLAQQAVGQTAHDPRAVAELDEFIRHFSTDWSNVSSFYDLPWSAARFDRLEQLSREWQERQAKVDFDALSQQGRIDFILLRNELKSELDGLLWRRRRLSEMEELLPFRQSLQELERSRWQMKPLDAAASAAVVAAWPEQIKKLRERIERGRKAPREERGKEGAGPAPGVPSDQKPFEVPPLLARRAAAAVEELRGTLKNWFSFYDGYQPEFSWWLKKPHDDASKAFEEYAKFLLEEIAGLKGKEEDPLLGDPIGPDQLANALASEMLPYSAEELMAIGEREFAWCEARMKESAQQMGLGDDWKAALAKVKASFVPPGKQDELVSECAREAIRFVKDRELVTLPPLCQETWRLSMISPDSQKTLPYAAYNGQNMMVAYANEGMKHADKLMSMRGNNRHFTRIVTAHELIPGHHLQAFNAARERSYRKLFSTPFLVEGWAVYWEMSLWDLGYSRTPEDRIGMLFWRMNRAARIIVSLKFHLGKLSPAEMVGFLVERVGHERMGALSEVRRFIGGDYSPLYQCGYSIGALQLQALHQELVGSGKLTPKQFNDAVLSYGPIPVELIRAGLLGLPLTRETRAAWRFAE